MKHNWLNHSQRVHVSMMSFECSSEAACVGLLSLSPRIFCTINL